MKGKSKMQKKIITILLTAGLILASFAACSDDKKNTGDNGDNKNSVEGDSLENAPEKSHFTMMEKEYPVSFKSGDGEQVYVTGMIRKASIVAHDRTNSPISKAVNARLETAYERNNSSANALMDAVVDAFKDESFNAEEAKFPWTINTEYELIRNDGLVLTFKEKVDYFAGGEPVSNVYYYNFNTKTAELVEQIMYTPGDDKDRDEVDSVIYKKLCDKYGEDVISYDNVSSSFAESAVDCWYFTENGIKIDFNAGTIAPVEAGTFEVQLGKDELSSQAAQYFLD